MDKIEDLPTHVQPIVRAAIRECKFRRTFKQTATEIGQVYVYPAPHGGICWGINSNDDGCNLKRGVAQ